MVKTAFRKIRKLVQQIGLKSKDENSGVLVLERNFLRCWEVHTSKIRSEIPEKFWNVLLKKKVGDTDGVRKDEVFHGARKNRNIIQTIKIKNANLIGHILNRD